MKNIAKLVLLFFVGLSSVSCSETDTLTLAAVDDSNLPKAFFSEAKSYLCQRDISLPDMAYTMGRVSAATGATMRNGGLSLDWSNVQYMETGNLEILMIPIEMQEPVTVARYYKENGKAGKTILTSLYPYLSVRKNKRTGAFSGRLVSYAPDTRFLRNHKLDFHNFLESQPLTKDYSGLFLVSEMDGTLLSGLLHYRGELKYKFAFSSGQTKCCDQDSAVASAQILSIGFHLTDPSVHEGMCNCNIDNESGSMDSYCDGCKQSKENCKCCFHGKDVCDRCGENPCVICPRCPDCGNYDDECGCNLCEQCKTHPCSCPICKSCGKKYAECNCSPLQDCYSKGCECPRCRN